MRQMLFQVPEFHAGVNVTVRHGLKWADLQPGELVVIFETDGGCKGFARAVVAIPLTVGAIPPALLLLEHDPSCRMYDGLLAELRRVYGESVNAETNVTVVLFDMLPRPVQREEIYALIDRERAYQDQRFPATARNTRGDDESASPEGFLLVVEELVSKARAEWVATDTPKDRAVAQAAMRKIAATAVRSMEQHGLVERA